MLGVHIALAVVLIGFNAAVAIWGLWLARSGRASRWFAHALAISQYSVLAVGLSGLFLLTGADRPEDPLHVRVYGPFMVIAIVAAFGFKTDDHVRNTRLFAVTALIVAALGVRALYTG